MWFDLKWKACDPLVCKGEIPVSFIAFHIWKLIQWRRILELEDKWELNAEAQGVCVGQCVWLGVHLRLEQLFDKSRRSWEGKRGSQ